MLTMSFTHVMRTVVSHSIFRDLLRDSLFTGVEYGKYDLPRILGTLSLYPQNKTFKLVIEEGGVQAVEQLVMARYYMFVQVYLHKTRRIYDEMMVRLVKEQLAECGGHYPADVSEYVEWDDFRVLEKAKRSGDWGRRFLNRDHFVLAHSGPPRPPRDGSELKQVKQIFLEIEHLFGDNKVITDAYGKAPIKFEHEDNEPTISILMKNDSLRSFRDVAPIVSRIDTPITVTRVYSLKDIKDDVQHTLTRKFQLGWEA